MHSFDYNQYGGLISLRSSVDPYENMVANGVHRISSGGVNVDFLAQDLNRLGQRRTILVCLGGALKNRAQSRGPFFSGGKIGKLLDLPLVSISDPTLEICPELLLSWYMGSAGHIDLPDIIAHHLDNLAGTFNANLVLFGGSGGGFGILNIQPRMRLVCSSVIWNPQTIISNYIPRVISAYAKHAFDHHGTIENSSDAEVFFESSRLAYNVTNVKMNGGSNLYLQNVGDTHVIQHMKPFVSNGQWDEFDTGLFDCPERGVVVATAKWGEGHAVLPRQTLMKALNATIQGASAREIAQEVRRDYSYVNSHE